MTVAAPTSPAAKKKKKRRIPAWIEFIVLLAVAISIAVVIKAFFVQMFFVPSTSMRPLFITDDRILVQKVSYWTGDVSRGDVIVFEDPGGQWLNLTDPSLNVIQKALSTVGLYPTGGHLVKRVIGVGGDHVVCCDKKGRITVNGVPLNETTYILEGTKPSDMDFDITVPEGRLWVMGDNRTNSEDSRYHQSLEGGGTVPVDGVVGKVWAIVWPGDRITLVNRPEIFKNPQIDINQP
ncbi:MAG TPA: signal peptidase I [Nocardioidaceae bacterium]|nr:signal peptidase I [Nocardioidaceae bacterium]